MSLAVLFLVQTYLFLSGEAASLRRSIGRFESFLYRFIKCCASDLISMNSPNKFSDMI